MPHADVIVRRPVEIELRRLNALIRRSKASWGYDDAFMEACREELRLSAADVASGLVRIAESDGTPVGVAEIAIEGREARLETLFVDPDHFGEGVGAALFGWAAGAAQERGADVLTIEADPGAAPFYRRVGAVDAGRVRSVSIPGRWLPRLVFDCRRPVV